MTLAHDIAGTGRPTVLLLHGIGGGKSIWSHTLNSLAQAGYRGVALDLPGYGDSTAGAPGGVDHMAAAVVDWLDTMATPHAVVVGHSMGGMVAQELAAVWPQRVSALVLACTSPAFGRSDGDWQAQFVRDRLAPLDAGAGMAGLAAQLVPAMLAPAMAPHAHDAARGTAEAVMSRVPEPTYRRVLQAIVGFDRRAALPAIQVPTLCLAGEHDRTASPEVHRRMAERIRGAEFNIVPGAGHLANLEKPEAFDQALIDFLRRHVPPGQETSPS